MKVDEFDFRVHGLLAGTRFALVKLGEQSRDKSKIKDVRLFWRKCGKFQPKDMREQK